MVESELSRGRPRIHSDHEILAAAMDAFAEFGYEAMSVRLLNRDLGLSHGTISQRFGPKQQLFFATIDWARQDISLDFTHTQGKVWTDDLDELYDRIYEFLIVASRRPQIIRFVQKEGTTRTPQIDYVTQAMPAPHLQEIAACLQRLINAGRIRPVDPRSVVMLMTFGATAPMTMPLLVSPDGGPIDPDVSARQMTELLVSGLKL